MESGERFLFWTGRRSTLTRGQRATLKYAARSLHNKQIAEILGIAESTVKGRLREMYAELGLPDHLAVFPYYWDVGYRSWEE